MRTMCCPWTGMAWRTSKTLKSLWMFLFFYPNSQKSTKSAGQIYKQIHLTWLLFIHSDSASLKCSLRVEHNYDGANTICLLFFLVWFFLYVALCMQLKTCLIFVNENVKTNRSERARSSFRSVSCRSVALSSFTRTFVMLTWRVLSFLS